MNAVHFFGKTTEPFTSDGLLTANTLNVMTNAARLAMIEMATVNGAKALGRYDTGEIALGKAADLCVVALDKPHLNPCVDPANLIVHSAHASDVAMTIVDGRIVYERSPEQSWIDINHERAEFDFEMSLRRLKIK